ncbi:MAG: hypothetical protein WBC07_08295 [Methylotenera sp.]
MNNLKSAGKDILKFTGNASFKGADKTAKWMATDHIGTAESSKLIEMSQELNYAVAEARLFERRTQRLVEDAQNKSGIFGVIYGWLVDHASYLLDLLWGFIWPIIVYLLWIIFSLVLMLLLYVLLFYVLYLFFTS